LLLAVVEAEPLAAQVLLVPYLLEAAEAAVGLP